MTSFFASDALLPDGWARNVRIDVNDAGTIKNVERNTKGGEILAGPVLPGMANLHSHAFQRAMAGLTEIRGTQDDDFWSWRERMYGVALRITPDQLRAIAAQLYTELLAGGYTQVCEFHYLHHREDGQPYDDELAMSWALADAARDATVGLGGRSSRSRGGPDATSLSVDQDEEAVGERPCLGAVVDDDERGLGG